MKAKSDPKIWYMNRKKKLQDEIHPELTFFSAKNLRDQASRVEENTIAMETEYRFDKNKKEIATLLIMTVLKKIPIRNLST